MKSELDSSYQTPTSWSGRQDPVHERLHQKIQCIDLRERLPQEPGFGFIGFCCDEGVRRNQGRPGAADGPKALREALQNYPFGKTSLYDCGDIICPDRDLEKAQLSLANAVALLLQNNVRSIVLGGGHEVAWGHFQGIVKAFPGKHIAIVNIDAHYDLRPLKEGQGSSGTSFLQMAHWCQEMGFPFQYTCIGIQKTGNTAGLFNTANELGVETVFAEDLHLNGAKVANEVVDRILDEHDLIYLTICLDAFASPYAPGVSAPQILGATPWQVIPLLQKFSASGKIIGLDIAELAPKFDEEGKTAQLGASLISQFFDDSK